MRDYVALVERLREARKHIWTQPQIELYPIMYEAADAIEELVGFIQQSERDRDGGMNDGRLIDAVRLQGEMMELIHEGYGLEDMVDAVIEAPTVDSVPVVRHGRWKGAGMGDYYCSLCQRLANPRTNYCPNCGAKMTEVTTDEPIHP